MIMKNLMLMKGGTQHVMLHFFGNTDVATFILFRCLHVLDHFRASEAYGSTIPFAAHEAMP